MINRNFEIYNYAAGGMLPTQEDLVFQGANIDFGDYIEPNMNLIASNAAFAQKVANDRLEDLMKERQAIIDAVKLDKRFANLQGQLIGQLDSLVEQASKSQLSDNANFTKFNTGLIKVKNDPAIQNALKSTEYAKAYADWRIKNPNAVDKDYLNGGNERDFQRFQNGETDEFVMRPTYVEPKWREDVFKFVKEIPDEEKEIFKTMGSAVYQEKTKGKTAEDIKARTSQFANYLLNGNPETASHFSRMQKFGYDPIAEIQQVINTAADQYKNESVTLSNMQANPNKLTPYQQRSLAVQEMNAETSRMNALERAGGGPGTEKSGGKGLQVDIIEGATAGMNKVNIKNGNLILTDNYIDEIAKTKGIPAGQITIENADLNSGNIEYMETKFDDKGEQVLIKRTMHFPTLVKQNQTPLKTSKKTKI